MRRTLIIIAVVVVLIGGGLFTYFHFFAGSASVTVAPGSTSFPVAGQGNPIGGTTIKNPATGPASTPTAVSARLVKISPGPVVPGEVIVNKKTATSTTSTVNYIERESGNVFSYSVGAKTLARTSNKTIPGIQSASWLPNGSFAFVRYLSGADFSTINTYGLPASSAAAAGFFLPQNLADISVSSTSILTLASGTDGSSATLVRTDGTHATTIFGTPLSALRVSFAGKNQYLVFSKPSATLAGDAYLVDTAGHFSRIAGPLDGLVALASHTGKWVLVSYIKDGAMQMELANTKTGEALPLPVATIADKCVWTADDSAIYCGVPVDPPASARYPDDWYQGAASFSDRVWKIQVSGRYAQLVLDFSRETNGSLDVESPAIDPSNTTLVFVNKNDRSLWGYSL